MKVIYRKGSELIEENNVQYVIPQKEGLKLVIPMRGSVLVKPELIVIIE